MQAYDWVSGGPWLLRVYHNVGILAIIMDVGVMGDVYIDVCHLPTDVRQSHFLDAKGVGEQ